MLSARSVPNLLTGLRLGMVPLALIVMLMTPSPARFLCCIFVAAAITDALDGFLARRLRAVSAWGAMLDQIADKLIVAVMLVYLMRTESLAACLAAASQQGIGGKLWIPASLILCRELLVSGLREWMALEGVALPVSAAGKWKTALQMIAITVLLWVMASPSPLLFLGGFLLLCVSALLALLSAAQYWVQASRALRSRGSRPAPAPSA